MAITLSVSQIRAALTQHGTGMPRGGGAQGAGSPTTAALGVMFHRIAGHLLSGDTPCGLQTVLEDRERILDGWKLVLREHAYDQLFGPLLTQQAAALQGCGEGVLNLWKAVQHLTDWLAELWWEISRQGQTRPDADQWFSAEQPLICELHRNGWPEPIVLLGQPDAILRIPHNGRWCVLDWKTGRTSPEIDLLQACLYHLMLHQEGPVAVDSALAVVSFRPEMSQLLFTSAELDAVRERLLDVIETLARDTRQTVQSTARPQNMPRAAARPQPAAARPAPPVPATPTGSPARTTPPALRAPQVTVPGTSMAQWQQETLQKVLRVLEEFGAPSRQIREPAVGPAFVRFFVYPQRGITIRRVSSAGEQLHLRLALEREPVISVDQGAIAIDLPRPQRQSLPFSQLLPHLPQADPRSGNARLPVGMDLGGRWVWCDLANSESCHMLVVGTPGSGKSEWLRVALATLLMTNAEDTLELLLIDPKRNAFTFAEGSPLLRQPILVPGCEPDTSDVLGELVAELDQRNELLRSSNSRDLREHVERTGQPTRRVIVICDEYAALLDGASSAERKAIEGMFKRIAQIGRAPGVHLILATQQPRANIITTAIRSLLPAKVALRVADRLESRVAIEENGAQNLLGNGDLLFKCIGTERLQAAWLPTDEERLVRPATRRAVAESLEPAGQTS